MTGCRWPLRHVRASLSAADANVAERRQDGGVDFTDRTASRAALDYADFLLPHLTGATHVLDIGCGDGALAVGLLAACGRVTAVDVSADDFHKGAGALRPAGLTFIQADGLRLPFRDASFGAVFAHSVLESGDDAARLLAEAARVLTPGGWLGVASVDYGGLVLAGPDVGALRRSNQIREQIWLRSGSDPFLGRELRRLVTSAGFVDVEATTKAFSYGTPARVREFAAGRAQECSDAGYVADVVAACLATDDEMAELAASWLRWASSDGSYAAFTWCRAVARRATPAG
jgi:SAM-dependent methyltransferase